MYFIESEEYFARPHIYGPPGSDYSDNARRYACFTVAALESLSTIAGSEPVLLHAHDWHTALAPVYLRTTYALDERFKRVKVVLSVHNAGFQGHFPPEAMADLGLAGGALQLAAARVVRSRELAQGRTGVRRRGDHGESHPRARAAHVCRRLRARRRVRRARPSVRRHRERHRSADLGSGDRSHSRRELLDDVARRKGRVPGGVAAASSASGRPTRCRSSR